MYYFIAALINAKRQSWSTTRLRALDASALWVYATRDQYMLRWPDWDRHTCDSQRIFIYLYIYLEMEPSKWEVRNSRQCVIKCKMKSNWVWKTMLRVYWVLTRAICLIRFVVVVILRHLTSQQRIDIGNYHKTHHHWCETQFLIMVTRGEFVKTTTGKNFVN